MKAILVILLLASSFLTRAQDSNIVKQRAAFKLQLVVDKGSVYESDIPASPYLNGPNVLQLYPGEKVFVQVEEENGVIKSMNVVKQNKYPAKTLVISFIQSVDNKKSEGMRLQVDNPFNMELTYSASILLMKNNKWVKTNVDPVEAKITSFEMWPDNIISIGLAEWALQKK